MTPGTVAIIHRGEVVTDLLHWIRTLPPDVRLVTPAGTQIARQRNASVERMVGDWLLFVDSDVIPPVDAVPRLLARAAPLVAAVIPERTAPFRVCATWADGRRVLAADVRGREHEAPTVNAVGTGCLLIRRDVVEAVPSPWFRCGQIVPDLLQEDTDFIQRAAGYGFPVTLDFAVRPRHIVTGVSVWAGRDGQIWAAFPGPWAYHVPLPVPATAEAPAVIGEAA